MANDQNIIEEAGLPPNWQVIDQAPIIPSGATGGTPPSPTGRDPYNSGVLPTGLGLQPDLYKTDPAPAYGTVRLMPVAPGGVPQNNSAVHSVVTNVFQGGGSTVINEGGSVISLETNGIPNVKQDVLNLDQGLNVVLASDNTGDVTVSVPVFLASGASHSSGAVPDPGSSAGTTHFLREDATWQVPPGSGGSSNYQTVQQNGSNLPAESKLNFLDPIVAVDNAGNTSTDVSILNTFVQTTTISVSAIVNASPSIVATLAVPIPATGGTYRIRAIYTMYLSSGNAINGFESWITDNVNPIWGFHGFVQTSGQAGAFITASVTDVSRTTYAAGSGIITIDLLAQDTHSTSSWTVQATSVLGAPCFRLTAVVEAVN